eukprot:gene11993-biopygen21438
MSPRRSCRICQRQRGQTLQRSATVGSGRHGMSWPTHHRPDAAPPTDGMIASPKTQSQQLWLCSARQRENNKMCSVPPGVTHCQAPAVAFRRFGGGVPATYRES